MPYLTKEDLITHLYEEVIAEIIRDNETIATRAISSAVAEAKSYLSRYNRAQLFADAPVPADEHLKTVVKDIACWHLIKLANPNINMELFRSIYEDAVKWLTNIMNGKMSPEGWPYFDASTAPALPDGDEIYSTSNPKRAQHY